MLSLLLVFTAKDFMTAFCVWNARPSEGPFGMNARGIDIGIHSMYIGIGAF